MQPTAQQEAILKEADQGRNLMILARAGCGKSTTLCMIAQRLAPRRVVMLAFNKNAQLDLEKKIERLNDEAANSPQDEREFIVNAQALTFNALGHRSFAQRRLTLNKRKPWLLLEDLQRDKNISFSRSEQADLASALNAARNQGLVPPNRGGTALTPWSDEAWEALFEAQEIENKNGAIGWAKALLEMCIERTSRGLIDYVDQLYTPAIWGGNFPYAHCYLVDEAQDLNPLQHKILQLLPTKQIIAVGDDRQAIYAFRGALSDSMERLRGVLKDPPVLPLSQTWRCAQSIVERQLHLVPDFKSAVPIQGSIEDWRGRPWSPDQIPNGMAILCRNNAPLLSCALKLLAAGKKVTILGREFAERLLRDIEKAVGEKAPSSMDLERVLAALERFYKSKSKNKDKLLTAHESDRIEALRAVAESNTVDDLGGLRATLQKIFSEDSAPITLATGHKSKGLEWPMVMHLEPGLIPSKWAESAEDLMQEENIRYVIETRPMETLILANLEDMG